MSELEDSLRAGGSKVAEGEFKVDARRALAKLRAYRLAEPHAWVLEILRAGAFAGARTVEVETDADDVKVTFGGPAFSADVMNDLLAQALDSKGAGAARYLSLGIAGALGLEPKWIRVRSGKVALEILPPDQVKVAGGKDQAGTFVHVRKRFGWNVIKASIADQSPEETAIFKSAAAFGPKLTHNGKAVNGDRFPGGLLVSAEFQNAEMHVVVGIPAKAKHGQLVFDVGGVVVSRKTLDLPGRFVVAWARCDAMRRNASGSDVVDSDSAVKKVRAKIDALTIELLGKLSAELGSLPPAWRKRFQGYALDLAKDGKLHGPVRQAVSKLPLIPGQHAEWYSADDFAKEREAGRPIYFTTESFPRGSCPTPSVWVPTTDDPILQLLPSGKRVDAAKQVRAKVRAAEARARWLASPIEQPALPEGRYGGRAVVATPTLVGEVGLVEKVSAGAFVRLLCQGRFVQQAQVPTLAPLRLRAVVDSKTEVPDATWAEMPSDKLMRSVTGAIEAAAERALVAGLAQAASPELQGHARDLLIRRANLGGSLGKLPDGVKEALLLDLTDGTQTSLKAMGEKPVWHYVRARTTATLLSGEPVLVLADASLREALGVLAPKRLKDATARLELEREIRRRLDAPRREAKLSSQHQVVVPIAEEGLRGEVAVPRNVERGANLTLLRDGTLLEKTDLTEIVDHVVAIVDSEDFVPNDDWDAAVRNGVFSRALRAVRMAAEQLPAVLVQQFPFPIDALGEGHARFLVQFIRRALVPGADPHPCAAAVAAAPLFTTNRGPLSIDALRAHDRLFHLPPESREEHDAEGLLVVYARPEHVALLGTVLGHALADGRPAIERIRLARQFRARPKVKLEVGEGVLFAVDVAGDGVHGTIGFVDRVGDGTALTLLVEDRVFTSERFLSNLPMGGMLALTGVEPSERELPPGPRAKVHEVLPDAEARILKKAIGLPGVPAARKAMLLALGERLEKSLPHDVAAALLDQPLFDCTDGIARSARTLGAQKRVLFVTKPIHGEPASKEPIVVLPDSSTRAALRRWTCDDVTEQLAEELDARAAREQLPTWISVTLREQTTWKRPISEPGIEGEVGILTTGNGTLTLLQTRRRLTTVDGVLPSPLSAVVNCDALKPGALGKGVERDAAYDRVIAAVTAAADQVLDAAAAAVTGAHEDQQRALGALLTPLAHWLVERKLRSAALVHAPLFETTGRALVSLDAILTENKKHQAVKWSKERGEPLATDRWVWRPRQGEAALLHGRVKLEDATAAILQAHEVRSRAKVAHLRAPVPGDWREPLTGALEGEVALRDKPTGALLVALHRERIPLEDVESAHPVGAVASVNSEAVSPSADWSRASRNLAFKRVMAGVEDALERLLARRLAHRDVYWRDYAEAAVKWKRGTGTGALGAAIATLPLFLDLHGRERTVGDVLEQQARHGRVLIADRGLPAPDDRVVFEHSVLSDPLFDLLQVKTEDIGPLLAKRVQLAEALKARRLETLKYAGNPIVRLDVHGEGFRGELVVLDLAETPEVVLARDGIRVCTRAIAKDLPVGGVVDVDALVVDDEWTKGELPKSVARALDACVEPLFMALAAAATRLDPAGRVRARNAALVFLSDAGVASAFHLDRMTGAAAALAGAPLFLTEEGVWVSLKAIADQVLVRGWVSVFEQSWRKRDTAGELVLRTPTLKDPWISGLEKVLGPSCVERVRDVALWHAELAERDPPDGTPAGVGLGRLRHQLKLLRSGALGHVTPDELDDVRLRGRDAPAPITYDPKRKLALLDGSDPAIARALAEIPTRPERLYVLLAAIYGAVNRALDRVTDADEAELLAALATHLAANPKLLRPEAK